jgi:hypothetical protein
MARLAVTSSGRISLAPNFIAVWLPSQPPTIAPTAMLNPSNHRICPFAANIRTAATLLVQLKYLVSAVAFVRP